MCREWLARVRRGFTLIEAIVAIAVISVIGMIASFVLADAVDGYAAASTRGGLHLDVSVAMDQVSRELRAIPRDGVGPEITRIRDDSIEFGTGGVLEVVGGNLEFTPSGGSSAVVLTGVTELVIEAWDESNVALSAPLNGAACEPVRRLSVTIEAERGGVTDRLRTKVFIRSMMEGMGP